MTGYIHIPTLQAYFFTVIIYSHLYKFLAPFIMKHLLLVLTFLISCSTPETVIPEVAVRILGTELEKPLIEDDVFHRCYKITVTGNTGYINMRFEGKYMGQWVEISDAEVNYHTSKYNAQNVIAISDCIHVRPLEVIYNNKTDRIPIADLEGFRATIKIYGSKNTDQTIINLYGQ